MDNFCIAPSSHGESRAQLLPEPSEDVSDLLAWPSVLSEDQTMEDTSEYLPEEAISWVVTVDFPAGTRLTPDQVESLTATERERIGSWMGYGLDADTGKWSFLICGDAPQAVSGLKFAFDYADEGQPAPASLFRRRELALEERLRPLCPVRFCSSQSPQEAAGTAARLCRLKEEVDHDAQIRLIAGSSGFEGRALWDALTCLGLEWGDMDCFHWLGPSGDPLFSVYTSTDPGYFFPEEVAAGEVVVEDLVFSFSIPRSPAPDEVYAAMLAAARYCQRRLGGDLEECEPELIAEVVSGLRAAGLRPGETAVLQLI